jgi:hypothetical protein
LNEGEGDAEGEEVVREVEEGDVAVVCVEAGIISPTLNLQTSGWLEK